MALQSETPQADYVAHVYGNAHRIEGAPRTLSLDEAKAMAKLDRLKLPELKNAPLTEGPAFIGRLFPAI